MDSHSKGLTRMKRTVAVAQKNCNLVAHVIGDHNVRLAVAVQITHGDGNRTGIRGKTLRRLKRAVDVSQKNPDGIARRIGDDQIELSVTVKISRGHGRGRIAHTVKTWRAESTVDARADEIVLGAVINQHGVTAVRQSNFPSRIGADKVALQ